MRLNVFCNIFCKTWAIPMKFGMQFPEWICCENVNVFHLTSSIISTLCCKTWYAHHWVVKEKKYVFHLNCCIKIRQIWISAVDYRVWEILQEKMFKICITDVNALKQRLRTEWPSWIMSSLRQPFVSGVVGSSRSVMRVLYTFSCNISTH